MKKRIAALVLLLCMLVSVLAGCAYSYADDDMSQYVTTTKEELLEALKNLKIEDGDFTTNEETREKKVADALMSAIAAADLGESKTAGTASAGDKVYYRYFALLSTDLENAELDLLDYDKLAEKMLFASNMTGSAQSSVIGLNFPSNFDKALKDALVDYTFGDSTNFATEASDVAVDKDDVIFVSFKKTYKDGEGKDKTETFTSMRLWNSKNASDPFTSAPSEFLFDNFIGKKTTDTIAEFKYTAGGVEYTVKDAKILSIVKAPTAAHTDKNYGTSVVVKCTPYTGGQTVKNVKGEAIKVGDVELTYFVYPVSFTDVKAYETLTAEEIIKDVLGKNITADVFDEESLKKTASSGATLETLINGDTSEGAAAEMKESLAAIFGYIETPKNHADVTATTATEAEIKTRYEGYRDARINAIKTIADIDSIVRTDYEKNTYDELEAAYVADVRKKLSDEFHHVVMDIKIKTDANGALTLPEDAVDEIYDIFYENEKYTFNYGYDTNQASATYNQANYKIYGGSFNNYLIKNFTKDGAGTAKDAKAAIRALAEEFVATSVKVHFAADAVGALISDADFEKRYDAWYANWEYQSQIYAYLGMSYPDPGVQGMRVAFQTQDLYDALLYVTGEKEAIDAYLAAYENDNTVTYDFDNVVYTTIDGVKYLDFVNIKYKTTAK